MEQEQGQELVHLKAKMFDLLREQQRVNRDIQILGRMIDELEKKKQPEAISPESK